MKARSSLRRLVLAPAVALAVAVPVAVAAAGQASADASDVRALNVDLATTTGPATGVGEGILYGISQDGTQPDDQYLAPLKVNAFRGGGWFSGGWIKDGYRYGTATQADIDSILAQARRLQQPPYHDVQYQLLVSDLYGANAGQPANTIYPCANGDCANWISFIDSTVGALQASGLPFAYDIWNEPELSIFWKPGVNTAQYFDMWDTAYREIRRIAPGATIVGPSFAFTPLARLSQWQTWLAHVKQAGTVPDMITNHDEGDVDDPVTVSQAIDNAVAAAGLPHIPLSANEYQPADRQTAGVTAWYAARFAQSDYTNAMRGNWTCCMIPNLTGLLAQGASGWAPTGNWWALRTYADLTGSLVATSGQVGSTAVSAAEDPAQHRAVAIVGDSNGYTGEASVTFTGLQSVPRLVAGGKAHITVYRIPDQAPLYAPQVVVDKTVTVTDDTATVPFTFQAAHDAFAIYVSWSDPQVVGVDAPEQMVSPGSYDVPVTLTNGSGLVDVNPRLSLAVSAPDPSTASLITVACRAGCGPNPRLQPGQSVTATFRVTLPAGVPQGGLRLTGTATTEVVSVGQVTAQNAADTTLPCATGQTCEAETGTLAGGACTATDHPGYTGTGFVACLTSTGPSTTQRVAVNDEGTYTLDLRYSAGPNGPDTTRTASVSVNGTVQQQIQLPLTGSWDTWADATTRLHLNAGLNTITVSNQPGDTGWYNLDHLVVTP